MDRRTFLRTSAAAGIGTMAAVPVLTAGGVGAKKPTPSPNPSATPGVTPAANVTPLTAVTTDTLFVNVMDHGAKCDGVTDDRAAVNAAVQAAYSSNVPLYFPRGTCLMSAPSGGSCISLPGGIEIFGAHGLSRLKIANSNGGFYAIIAEAGPTVDLSGLYIHDLVFDGNNTGNRLTSAQLVGFDLPDPNSRSGMRFNNQSSYLRVECCRFTDFDSEWQIAMANQTDVSIVDCQFDNIGSSSLPHDMSSIYLDVKGGEVRGNTFRVSSTGSLSARTAIELHGGPFVARENKVFGFQLGLILTASAVSGPASGTCSDNVLSAVSMGISVWPNTGQSAPDGVQDLSLHDNIITVDYNTWKSYVVGPAIGLNDAAPYSKSVSDVQIHGNEIRWLNFSGSAAGNAVTGIWWGRTGGTDTQNTDISIHDNHVWGAPHNGIAVFANTLSRLRVERNTVVNSGRSGLSGYNSGIAVTTYNLPANDLVVQGNLIIDDQTPHTMGAPISLNLTQATASRNLSVRSNSVRYADGTVGAVVAGGAGAGTQVYVEAETLSWTAPAVTCAPGSRITDLSNGVLHIATTAGWRTL